MADILRMIVVLSALCGLSGFALSYLKMVTAPVIDKIIKFSSELSSVSQ